MNILIISSLTSRSGSAVRFWNIAKELGKLGHKVCFIERAYASDKKTAPNVIYSHSPIINWSLSVEIIIAMVFNIIRSLFFRADVVFALKPLPNSCIPAILKKLTGARILLDIDDLDYEYYPDGSMKRLVHLFYKIFPAYFHKITLHTKPLKHYVSQELKVDKKDIIFLPQGIDCKRFENIKRDNNLLNTLGLQDYKVLIYAASLGIASDLEPTLTVFRDLVKERKDVKLLVLGNGNLLDHYKQIARDFQIADKVVFAGHIQHCQVAKYIALGDVALNYLQDNTANKYRSSIKVREYLALGIPVVCNIIGDTDLFSEYVYIFDSTDEYRTQIIKALDRFDEPKIRSGQIFVKQNYDWSKIIPEFEKDINSLLCTNKKQ